MKINSLIQMNDWGIKKFLFFVLAFQLAMIGMVALSAMGIDMPVLRQATAFIYLTFIPGILILRVLKIHNLDATRTLLYSVGLSIAFVMFVGLFTNSFLHLLNVSQPMSTWTLTVTLAIFVMILCGMVYVRDRGFQSSGLTPFEIKDFLSPSYLFLMLLPLLAVLGAFLIHFHQSNILWLTVLLLIALVPALVVFDKFIPPRAYPLAIVMMTLSLVLPTMLVSNYPLAYNNDFEFYHLGLVINNGYWDSSLPHVIYSALSIVMLGPIYALILNINMIWLPKVIYPLFYPMLPLAVFAIYREQMDAKKAFLSVFFFLSMFSLWSLIILLRRVLFGELFFALLILLMVDDKLTSFQKTFLSIIFVLSLGVTYYGVAYIGLAFFFIAWLLLVLMRSDMSNHWQSVTGKGREANSQAVPAGSRISVILITLWAVFTLAWYMYIAGGVQFASFIGLGQHISTSITEFFSPEVRPPGIYTAMGKGFFSVPFLAQVNRVLHYITELFIIVGFIRLILKPKSFKFKDFYIAFTSVAALFLLLCILIPHFVESWSASRSYHFVLILLSPLCIVGGEVIWQVISKLYRVVLPGLKRKQKLSTVGGSNTLSVKGDCRIYLRFLVLAILIPLLLFQTGFICEIAPGHGEVHKIPTTHALAYCRGMDTAYFTEKEVSGAEWLAHASDGRILVAGDYLSDAVTTYWLPGQVYFLSPQVDTPQRAYIYLREWNIEKQEVICKIRPEPSKYINILDEPKFLNDINNRNKIYDSGGAHILAP